MDMKRLVLMGVVGGAVLVGGMVGKGVAGAGELPPREMGGVAAASMHLTGGLRALPRIALWRRAEVAAARGDRFAELALYDLIAELSPSNAPVAVHQIRTEGEAFALGQPDRPGAARWLEGAVRRVDAAQGRMPESALIHESAWYLGFYTGARLPGEYALMMARLYGDEALEAAAGALLEGVAGHPAAGQWLDRHGLSSDASRDGLTARERALLAALNGLRLRGMALAATATQECSRHRRPLQVMQYGLTMRLLSELADDADDVAQLMRQARDVFRREVERLRAGGQAVEAGRLEHMWDAWFGEWLAGGD